MRLKLSQIKADIELSPRIERGTVAEIVEGYAECFDQLPPIIVFKVPDQTYYLLVDGWHRYCAAKKLKLEEVEVDKKAGTLEEAKEYALLANLRHGLPLTRKEKRHVIGEFLKLHPERTNKWLARDLGMSVATIIKAREELEQDKRFHFETFDVLIAKDGRKCPRHIEQPKKQEKDDEEEAEEEEAEKEKDSENTEAEQPEPEPAPEPDPVPMLGAYQLNQAHQADCIEVLMELPESCIDLVFADPPYNLGKDYGQANSDKLPSEEYFTWCMKWFMGVFRVLKPGGVFYIMHYPEVAARWKQHLDSMFTFQRWLTWAYPVNVGHSKNNWTRAHRTILYYAKGSSPNFFDGEADPQPYKNPDDLRIKHSGKRGTTPYDWWEYNLVKNVSKDKTDWPNQLPIGLVKRIIVTSCPKGGVVCDPFVGSGTTAVAAIEADRDWLGFDIEAKAVKVTGERIREVFRRTGADNSIPL
jgi:site-specific DNA-methyltransferase (adenine-specific)